MTEDSDFLPERVNDLCADAGSLPALADIDALKAARVAATKALSEATHAHLAAKRAVDEQHTPVVAAAKKNLVVAQRAYDEAVAAQSSHPWVGRLVTRTVEKRRGSVWPSARERVEERGVVEIVGPSNPWGGKKYSQPEPGTPVVRLLKKDGKPGSKHETLVRWDYSTKTTLIDGWSLVGGEAAHGQVVQPIRDEPSPSEDKATGAPQ